LLLLLNTLTTPMSMLMSLHSSTGSSKPGGTVFNATRHKLGTYMRSYRLIYGLICTLQCYLGPRILHQGGKGPSAFSGHVFTVALGSESRDSTKVSCDVFYALAVSNNAQFVEQRDPEGGQVHVQAHRGCAFTTRCTALPHGRTEALGSRQCKMRLVS
jgi:hypothetical protein